MNALHENYSSSMTHELQLAFTVIKGNQCCLSRKYRESGIYIIFTIERFKSVKKLQKLALTAPNYDPENSKKKQITQ
jgi:hypothetical protein